MLEVYINSWVDYGRMDGRVGVSEYGKFSAMNAIVLVFFCAIDFLLEHLGLPSDFAILSIAYGLASIIPNVSMFVMRLHDIGKSGFMGLIALIPILGILFLLYVSFAPGQKGNNEYG